MKTIEGNYVMCSSAGKICYTEREADIVINGCNKKFQDKFHEYFEYPLFNGEGREDE